MLFNCGRADKGDEDAVFAHLLSCGVPRLTQRYNVRCLDSWGDSSLGPRCPKVGGPWELSFEKLKNAVSALMAMGNIHIHLDLIAGLPKEDWQFFFPHRGFVVILP